MGAPFQRATPTRRAPPGAAGTLPPPPGRPVVPGLLWALYISPTHYLYAHIISRLGESVCTLPHAPEAVQGAYIYEHLLLPPPFSLTEYRRAELGKI